jgi:hypothetical protein
MNWSEPNKPVTDPVKEYNRGYIDGLRKAKVLCNVASPAWWVASEPSLVWELCLKTCRQVLDRETDKLSKRERRSR